MSTTVENKVLEMRFENKQFEENVAESISTLKKLKENLEFDSVKNNFDSLTKASEQVDFSSLSGALDNVGQKFNLFEQMAIGALRNIGATIENELANKIRELSFGQIEAGWGKYEEKVSSVQTIMAATGKSIEEVQGQLERLNWFSDETSYSFTDMTSNVGKFTSVGVELEDAVSAMEGISTWAALSGANSQTAARAMYNLSQAMGVGAVKLMDWRSIENAGMATSEFKEIVLDTAAAMGTLTKYADGTYQTIKGTDVAVSNFSSTLAEGWFDKDVLMESLATYGNFANDLSIACQTLDVETFKLLDALDEYDGSQESLKTLMKQTGMSAEDLTPIIENLTKSEYELGRKAFRAAQEAKTFTDMIDATKDAVSTGWMNTFEIIFGNYEEAKSMFSDLTESLYTIFAESGNTRNQILKDWAELGGGKIFRTGLVNVLEGIANIVDFIRDIIYQTVGIFRISQESIEAGADRTYDITQKIFSITEKFGAWAKTFKEFTEDIGDNIEFSDDLYQGLSTLFDGIGSALSLVFDAMKALTPVFKIALKVIHAVADFIIGDVFYILGEALTKISEFIKQHKIFEKLVGGVTAILTPVITVLDWLVNTIGNYIGSIAEAVKQTKIFEKIFEGLSILFSPVIEKLRTFFSFFSKEIKLPTIGKTFDIKPIQDFSDKIVPFFEGIREKLDSLWQTFENVFSKISDVLSPVKDKIKEFFGSLKEKADFSQFTSFHDILENIKKKLEPVSTFLENIFKSVKDFFSDFDLGKTFSDIWTFVTNITTRVWDFISNIDFSQFFSNLLTNIQKFGSNVGTWLGELFTGIANGVTGFLTGVSDNAGSSFSGLFKNLAGGLIIFKGLKSGEEGGSLLEKIFSPLTSLFEGLKEKIDSFIEETDEGKLKDIATSILLLGIALAIIASIDSERLDDSFFTVGAALAGLTLAMDHMSKIDLDKGKGMKAAGLAMVELSGALLILSWAAKSFSSVSWGDLGKTAAVLGGLLVSFTAIGLLTKTFNMDDLADKMKTFAGASVTLGIAFKVIAWAAKDFESVEWGSIAKMAVVLGALVYALAGLGIIFDDFADRTDDLIKISESFIIIGAALKVIAWAAESFNTVSWDSLGKAGSVLGGLVVYIALLSAIFKKLDTDTDSIIAGSASLIILGIGMEIMAKAAESFNNVDWGSLGKIGAVAGGFLVFVEFLKLIGARSAVMLAAVASLALMGPAMILFAGGVTVLCEALKFLSHEMVDVNWGGLGTIAAIVATVIGLMTLAIPAMAAISVLLLSVGAGVALVGGGVALIGVGLMTIASALALINLSQILHDIDGIGQSLRGVFREVAINIFLQNVEKALKILPNLISTVISGLITGIVNGITAVLTSLKNLALNIIAIFKELAPAIADGLLTAMYETLKAIADNLGNIVPTLMDIVFKLLDYLITYVPTIVEKLVVILCEIFDSLKTHIPTLLRSFIGFVDTLVGGIMELAEGVDQDTLLKIAEMFLGLVAVIEVLNLIKSQIPGAMLGLAEVAVFVAELGAIIALFGAINSIPGVQDLVEKGGDLLEAIGVAFGKLIGGFAGGLAEGATSTLPKVGENIAKFWENIKPFIDGVGEMGLDTAEKVAILSACIVALTASDFLGGIADFQRKALDLPEFGVSIANMWKNIQPFIDGVKSLKKTTVQSVGFLSDAILKLTASQLLDGITSFIFGKEDMEKFGNSIGALGPHLANFAESVKDIKTEPVKVAAEAIGILAEAFSDNTFKTGGLFQWVTGETVDLKKFGERLAAFGPEIVKYANSVKDMNVQNVKPATEAIIEIVKAFDNDVFKTGGVMQWFKGENGIAEFGTALKSLGPNLRIYATAVKGLSVTDINTSAEGIERLGKIVENLPEKSAWERLFKIDRMREFTDSVKLLGESLKEYYDNIASIKYEQMSAMIQATTDLFDLFSGESGVTFKISNDFKKAMREIASTGIGEFVASFAESVSQVHDAGEEFITTFSEGISESVGTIRTTFDELFIYCMDKFETSYRDFKKAGRTLMENFALGISNTLKVVKASVNTILSAIYDQVTAETLKASFKTAGEDLMLKFNSGVMSKLTDITASVTSITAKVLEPFNDETYQSSFTTAGETIMSNFISGISSKILLLAATAAVASSASLNQFNAEEITAAYYTAGSSAMSEYVRGMETQAPYVQQAAAVIVSSARASVEGELQALKNDINSWIDNNVDFNPVITPTIDTTDLEAALADLREEYADVLNAETTSGQANGIVSDWASGQHMNINNQTIYDTSTGQNITVNANYNVYGNYDLEATTADIARRLARLNS